MNNFTPFYTPYAPELAAGILSMILVLVLWSVVWKGLALWHAARNNQTAWFVVLLVVNTVGILEIVYLIWFRPHTPSSNISVQSPTGQV